MCGVLFYRIVNCMTNVAQLHEPPSPERGILQKGLKYTMLLDRGICSRIPEEDTPHPACRNRRLSGAWRVECYK